MKQWSQHSHSHYFRCWKTKKTLFLYRSLVLCFALISYLRCAGRFHGNHLLIRGLKQEHEMQNRSVFSSWSSQYFSPHKSHKYWVWARHLLWCPHSWEQHVSCHHLYPKLFKGSLTSDLCVCLCIQPISGADRPREEVKAGNRFRTDGKKRRKTVKKENGQFSISVLLLGMDCIIFVLLHGYWSRVMFTTT